MLFSMTGFGSGSISSENWNIIVEARSFNSRFCEIQVKLPAFLGGFEQRFENLARKFIARGKVIISVHIAVSKNADVWELFLDEDLLDSYASLIEQIESRLAPERTVVSIDRILSMPDIVVRMPNTSIQKTALSDALDATSKALKKLYLARKQEGKIIQKDVEKRIKLMKKIVAEIEEYHSSSSARRFARLREQIKKVTDGIEIEPTRLEQEIALLALKHDYTEELVRLKSHIERFEKTIKGAKSCGSLLNFILQECHREANAIASKNDIIEVSALTIELREEIERLREQIQNIE